jgi:hypothetical protein
MDTKWIPISPLARRASAFCAIGLCCEVKKTEKIQAALVNFVEKGLSLSRAGQCLGLHHKTVLRWKSEDEKFAGRIDQAEARFIARMVGKIEAHADTDWRAAVELLARRFPEEFSKPESRLAITQVNVEMGGVRTLDDYASKSPAFRKSLIKLAQRCETQN